MPQLSLSTLAIGAKQLVVHEAFETISSPSYLSKLTPQTNIGVSSLEGALNTTCLAPAVMCLRAVSSVRNKPVDSTTTSTSISFHFKSSGLRSAVTRITLSLTTNCPSITSTVPLKRPCVESYFNI